MTPSSREAGRKAASKHSVAAFQKQQQRLDAAGQLAIDAHVPGADSMAAASAVNSWAVRLVRTTRKAVTPWT